MSTEPVGTKPAPPVEPVLPRVLLGLTVVTGIVDAVSFLATVLTLTLTGLAADSGLAGGHNPGWKRRMASVVALFAGAALGAWMVSVSVALPLAVAAGASGTGAAAAWIGMRRD